MRDCLQRAVAGGMHGFDRADGTGTIHVSVIAAGDFDDITSRAHFCVIAVWRSRVKIDNTRVKIVDNGGVKIEIDIC